MAEKLSKQHFKQKSMKILKIATRKSPLALYQAQFVADQLTKRYPDLTAELIKITTTGDKFLDKPLVDLGGKSLFIKELEKSMLAGEADIAVHSMKDVPYELPPPFDIAAILKRDNPYDAFVSNCYADIASLPAGAVIGSCSARRIVQCKTLRPDLHFANLRGNIGRRLQQLDQGQYDGIILACCALTRLNLIDRITAILSPEQSLPAAGQGAIGIEVKKDDTAVKALLAPLNDDETSCCISAERAMNKALQASCQTAIATFAQLKGDQLLLSGLVGDVQTAQTVRHSISGDKHQAEQLGNRLAEQLLAMGASKYCTSLSRDSS